MTSSLSLSTYLIVYVIQSVCEVFYLLEIVIESRIISRYILYNFSIIVLSVSNMPRMFTNGESVYYLSLAAKPKNKIAGIYTL